MLSVLNVNMQPLRMAQNKLNSYQLGVWDITNRGPKEKCVLAESMNHPLAVGDSACDFLNGSLKMNLHY